MLIELTETLYYVKVENTKSYRDLCSFNFSVVKFFYMDVGVLGRFPLKGYRTPKIKKKKKISSFF